MSQTEFAGPFSRRPSAYVGQEILNADGKVVAWATDSDLADLICNKLTDHVDNHDADQQGAEEKAGRVISSERDVDRLLFVVDVAHRVVVNAVLLEKLAMERAEHLDLGTTSPSPDDELKEMNKLTKAIGDDHHLLDMYCY